MNTDLAEFDRQLSARWKQTRQFDDALLVLQLADAHLVAPDTTDVSPQDFPSRTWCAEQLDRVVGEASSLSVRPQVVLLSGDMTQSGMPGEWEILLSQVRRLDGRIVFTLGNHEHRNTRPQSTALARSLVALQSAGAPRTQVAGRYACTHSIDGWRIVVLDSADYGDLGDEQRAWLATQLTDRRPTIVSLHRPVIHTGHAVDELRLVDDTYEQIVQNSNHIAAVVCAHAHRRTVQQQGQVLHLVAPAISYGNSDFTGYRLLVFGDERLQWSVARLPGGSTVQAFRDPPRTQPPQTIWEWSGDT